MQWYLIVIGCCRRTWIRYFFGMIDASSLNSIFKNIICAAVECIKLTGHLCL